MNLSATLETSLTQKLQENWVQVEFTKKDGSTRVMKCTTRPDLIPEEYRVQPKEKKESEAKVDPNFEVEEVKDPNKLFKVFEEHKGWRSFRLNQVTYVNGEPV